MLPIILVAVGAYLIGDSVLEDGKKYAKGGKIDAVSAKKRLEQLRKELRAERISYAELAELESLSEYIDKDDVELREAAGIPENEDEYKKGGYMAKGGDVEDKKMIAKLKKQFDKKYQGNDFDFDKDDNFKVDGYNVEVFDWKEEDEMNDYIKMNSKDNYLVPYSSDDDNYYLIVVPKDKMAKGGKVGMPEWAVTITSEDGESYDWDGFAKSEDDALVKAEKEADFGSVESSVVMITDANGKKIEYKKGGKLLGKQKNLDVNKNGKLDAEDFKMLRGKK